MTKMGGKCSKLSECFHAKEARTLMVGLDAAGKTTILYYLQLGEVVRSFPTVGFNVETVDHNNISFIVWDVGGQENVRPLWKQYIGKCKGLIFVVDGNDRDRIYEATDMLSRILSEQSLQNVPLLVFANKQDFPNAMSCDELTEKLDLNSVPQRHWHVQGCCATSGQGLFEGLDWLSKKI